MAIVGTRRSALLRVAFLSLAASFAASAARAQTPVRIAIANFGEDPALVEAIQGFKKAFADAGYVDGKSVAFTVSHTNFDATLVPQMLAKAKAENPNLVFTLTTPVSQIAMKAFGDGKIPIVFGAVTDPVAARLTPSWSEGGAFMTGASDLQDIAAVLGFFKKLVPAVKKIGLPYNPGEVNDVALLKAMQEAAGKQGLEIVGVGVDSANDIGPRITALKGKADAVYVPTSNLLQPAVAAVASAARQAGLPIVNAAEGPVRAGVAPASYAVNYSLVGANAAQLAMKILKGEKPSALAPIRPAEKEHKAVFSRKALKAFGLEVPAAFADCNCIVD